MRQFLVGLGVGSTTVKVIVVNAATDTTIWQDYQRHETRQPEKVLEFLRRMEAEAGMDAQRAAYEQSLRREIPTGTLKWQWQETEKEIYRDDYGPLI